jgi:hypothetical protein
VSVGFVRSNLTMEVTMKTIPIKRHGRRQGVGTAVKAGIVLAVVAALCVEIFPLVHGMKTETAVAHAFVAPSTPAPDFVPNPMPDRAQLEKMQTAEPQSTF